MVIIFTFLVYMVGEGFTFTEICNTKSIGPLLGIQSI
jgi:hypothetical protein